MASVPRTAGDVGSRPGGAPAIAPMPRRKPRRRPFWRRDVGAGLLFLSPALIHFVVFVGGLVVASLVLSFMEWDLFSAPQWVGLENFRRLLDDRFFWHSLKVTSLYVLMVIPTGMTLSLLLALAVNTKLRGMRFFRTTYFIPLIASAVAVAVMWRWIYNRDVGILNWFLGLFGVDPINWLGSADYALPAVAIVQVWRGLGEGMIIFLAGLQAIPAHLYEAAALDGANRWRQFRHITWPLLTPTTFFVGVIEVIGSFQVFDIAFLLTPTGGPSRSTDVYNFYLYRRGFQGFEMGYAAAMAWILFLIIAVLTVVQFRVLNKRVNYELG